MRYSSKTGLQILFSGSGWMLVTHSVCVMVMSLWFLRRIALQCSFSSWMPCCRYCSSSHSHSSSMNNSFIYCSPTHTAQSMVCSLSLSVCVVRESSLAYMYIGTFLFDTPQERLKYRDKTHSLWSYLAQPDVTQTLRNPLYDRNNSVLLLSVSHLTIVSILLYKHATSCEMYLLL